MSSSSMFSNNNNNNNNNNSMSISVSDDESDELGRMRVRVRRKRKKPGYRLKNEFTRRVYRKLVRYWTLLIFIPAACLLIFEASRIGRKSSPVVTTDYIQNPNFVDSDSTSISKSGSEKKSEGNLNRLDPTTRVVGGVRQRCLKLLSPEELEHLDIPSGNESPIPVSRVVYMSENDSPFISGAAILSGQHTEATKFNLFTGNQTLDQRDNSFKVNETATLHCGFYSENGGFIFSDEDRNYMDDCKVVVSTCAFGGGDDLYQPIGMSEASLRKVCYVAFWDEITVASQQLAGHRIGDDGFIGKWRIVVVRDLPFSDQRLNGKIPKMLAHRLFPHAKYSIWVDSKSQFRRDPLGVLEALLWRSNSVLAISEHGARSSVYDEAKAVVKKNKAKPEEVEVQLAQYRHDGLPEDKRFNGKKALAEASVIVREHTPLTNMFMCLWFNEVVRFTSRDQLSFPYVLWRLKVLKNINMFPVCTRKDLVNSMGHLRKAKPLISRFGDTEML
ncbi:probable hexosyltransferase MUCI70 [Ziziphus jujuba]|uniref:Probable hexosyltransferase MUCI70 n=1 Tax=Ziziphus jujuba TaxID=326968 RepID=A0A6P3ZX94_ZIZJJ|nr:probable hexosyltransferase MUCI70 [Ziziphus jujuba]